MNTTQRTGKRAAWGYIVFRFKDRKASGRMLALIQMGKQVGIIPESVEVMCDNRALVLGCEKWNGGSRGKL